MRREAPDWPADRLWLGWLLAFTLLAFALQVGASYGVWAAINAADPTGITQSLLLVFAVAFMWTGARSWRISREWRVLRLSARDGVDPDPGSWIGAHLRDHDAAIDDTARATLLDVLADRSHGPHESAWWFNGLLLKLGLLGTVAGFVVMATQLAQVDVLDAGQAQRLLQKMNGGMGIALFTTLAGLVANMFLGLILLMLDRSADRFLAEASALVAARSR